MVDLSRGSSAGTRIEPVEKPVGRRQVLYPELWPAELRAAAILGVVLVAVYSGSWAAPVIERPSSAPMFSTLLFDLGQRWGGEDTRAYHALTLLLHLLSATLCFGILRRVVARTGRGDAFVPACLGALLWAVHPVLTEAVVAPSRGGPLLGGLLIVATTYGLLRVVESRGRWTPPARMAAFGVFATAAWLMLPVLPDFLAGLRLGVWPSPLVYDRGPAGALREAALYLPLMGLGLLVALAAAKIGPRLALLVFLLPVTVLGVMARARTADYRSALVLWRDTVTKAPENPRAHRELGRALMAAGRARDAIDHFERALALAPADLRTRLDLAAALMTVSRVNDAAQQYAVVVQAAPDHAAAHLELAVALTILNRKAQADGHFNSAKALGISDAELHRRRGRALAETGDFETAQAELESALRLEPKVGETHVILGMVLSAMGRTVEGMKHFVTAVELNPADAGAQAALGDALLEDLRPAEALPHFEAALRLDPARAAWLHASLGQALSRLGRAPEAIRHLEAALALNPENAEARANLELIRTALQRHAEKQGSR
jgi:tetratricopeptide (TPR) repeat protein